MEENKRGWVEGRSKGIPKSSIMEDKTSILFRYEIEGWYFIYDECE
jgi:hypothetical protein